MNDLRTSGFVRLAREFARKQWESDGVTMVRGCRCVSGEGDYRGVSTFDVMPLSLFLVWLGAIEASLKAEGSK
jgi:hypothetical protein